MKEKENLSEINNHKIIKYFYYFKKKLTLNFKKIILLNN